MRYEYFIYILYSFFFFSDILVRRTTSEYELTCMHDAHAHARVRVFGECERTRASASACVLSLLRNNERARPCYDISSATRKRNYITLRVREKTRVEMSVIFSPRWGRRGGLCL